MKLFKSKKSKLANQESTTQVVESNNIEEQVIDGVKVWTINLKPQINQNNSVDSSNEESNNYSESYIDGIKTWTINLKNNNSEIDVVELDENKEPEINEESDKTVELENNLEKQAFRKNFKNNEESEYAVEMTNITKTFLNGKVVANDGVNLRVKKNEVHAIIGENGAGKSTLMSMLFGIYAPDAGEIKINGNVVNFTSAKDADKVGLGMVHQHFKLVDEFTIWENVILGAEGAKLLDIINTRKVKKILNELIQEYDFKLNLNKKVREISVGQQQKTEILKLLYRNANILIFDEPTAVLSQDEIKSFLKMIKHFQEMGKTVIIITHKLNEIKEVANRATVIRRGKYIGDFDVKDKSIDEIAEMMVGKKIAEVKNPGGDLSQAPVKFEVKDLDVYKLWKSSTTTSSITQKLKKLFIQQPKQDSQTQQETISPSKVNFQIRAGEIYAIAGVEGNGQSELALAIAGMLPNGHATISLNGVNLNHKSVKKRYDLGVSDVPEDRHKHGLVLDMPIDKNSVLQEIGKSPFSKFGFINQNAISKHAQEIIRKYDVRGTSRGTTAARLLSGGNQQKLIIGREMERQHELLILVQPTRGMDLGAISFIHEQILEEKKKGKAILLISYELDEILGLADTIAVMQNGVFLEEGNVAVMTKQYIGELMAGKGR